MAKRRIEQSNREWSHDFDVAQLDSGPTELTIAPTKQQADDIAARLGVVSVDNLQAQISLYQLPGSHLVQVQGHLSADITQNCVVTLQAIGTHIRDEFDTFYADPKAVVSFAKAKAEAERKALNSQEAEILDERDDPEVIEDGKIDLGEMVVQYLSLAIDPYPQIPGAIDNALPEAARAKTESPFAALAALKTKSE